MHWFITYIQTSRIILECFSTTFVWRLLFQFWICLNFIGTFCNQYNQIFRFAESIRRVILHCCIYLFYTTTGWFYGSLLSTACFETERQTFNANTGCFRDDLSFPSSLSLSSSLPPLSVCLFTTKASEGLTQWASSVQSCFSYCHRQTGAWVLHLLTLLLFSAQIGQLKHDERATLFVVFVTCK